ncbi:DUF2892 domain-containing protein [Spirosoma sp. HMF4905]|uniref:DUF2892 domain-containing protein n=1 Tax=Spirosoma arboris TaxID=2682092 RepID=A0A7K1S9R2_9BACT|nr:DUF2892 domain-containing protein [Spirosoma arboris]MVM30505.1 DUF2892 domain-containing protein [Spirosoma arboris]
MLLKKNVSFVDQIIRSILIVDLLVPCLLDLLPSIVAYFFIGLSLVLVVSCITRYCWVYDLLKISTRQQEINF